MRGALPVAPLRSRLRRRIGENYNISDLVRDWVVRFPEANFDSIYRFVERVLDGGSSTVGRDRADEAALVLGLMPTDVWGEAWWD